MLERSRENICDEAQSLMMRRRIISFHLYIHTCVIFYLAHIYEACVNFTRVLLTWIRALTARRLENATIFSNAFSASSLILHLFFLFFIFLFARVVFCCLSEAPPLIIHITGSSSMPRDRSCPEWKPLISLLFFFFLQNTRFVLAGSTFLLNAPPTTSTEINSFSIFMFLCIHLYRSILSSPKQRRYSEEKKGGWERMRRILLHVRGLDRCSRTKYGKLISSRF